MGAFFFPNLPSSTQREAHSRDGAESRKAETEAAGTALAGADAAERAEQQAEAEEIIIADAVAHVFDKEENRGADEQEADDLKQAAEVAVVGGGLVYRERRHDLYRKRWKGGLVRAVHSSMRSGGAFWNINGLVAVQRNSYRR